ncbi:MAG: DUF401 family protein [Firmicutes bacterium]|nr:DUF401 family protein [Bacillota bacterium]
MQPVEEPILKVRKKIRKERFENHMLELLRLIAVCLLMIVLLRRNLNLGLTMLLAAAALGVSSGMGVASLGVTAIKSATSPDTLGLIIALVLIAFLEHAMRRAGLMQRMVGALRVLIADRRIIMAALPAFLGLLPSAGGARFSAPLVHQVTTDLEIVPERKAFINYWYRHIWECVMPIYPSIIVAGQVLNLPLDRLIMAMLPMVPITVVAGMIPAFKGMTSKGMISRETGNGEMASDKAASAATATLTPPALEPLATSAGPATLAPVKAAGGPAPANRISCALDALTALSPVIAIVVGVTILKLDIAVAVAAVLMIMIIVGMYSPGDVWKLVREGFSLNVVFLVLGVMLFRDILVASGALNQISAFLGATGVPPMILLCILPFLVAFSTGLGVTVPGIAFPLLMGILRTAGGVDLSLVVFAFVSGFVGAMLSPAHLCLVLTVDYFKASFTRVQNSLWAPALAVELAALLLAFL